MDPQPIQQKPQPLADALSALGKTISETEELISRLHDKLTVVRAEEPTSVGEAASDKPCAPVPLVRDQVEKATRRMKQINENLRYNLRTIEI
jgi:hypothetical protein